MTEPRARGLFQPIQATREAFETDWIRDTLTVIGLMDLTRSTRHEISARTTECTEHLRDLLARDLGADQDAAILDLFRRAYEHLDLPRRPTADTPAHEAFAYMRATAALTFELLRLYVGQRQDPDR
ncbi:hypothetical protein RM863_11715 [Streptomyces sp. DSM 41014]|uniref:Uncharacterized protein n=1 Tax=Streptomyces hintoniae TaxID=3075521 RepID=A0ABU2UHP6_9ACTN|nr:hypothetical protein [Streptomyces sp. DSM 41014]MDT0472793.1 hypothetical protein [Streptomyces sp. DSM 41014]